MQTIWTFEHGRIWATCADGRRVATWESESTFSYLVDVLNVSPGLSASLLAGWLGVLPAPILAFRPVLILSNSSR